MTHTVEYSKDTVLKNETVIIVDIAECQMGEEDVNTYIEEGQNKFNAKETAYSAEVIDGKIHENITEDTKK